MELGATVCVPNTEPRCGDCPVSGACAALGAQRAHAAAGGDPGSGPRVTDYPTKARLLRGGAGRCALADGPAACGRRLLPCPRAASAPSPALPRYPRPMCPPLSPPCPLPSPAPRPQVEKAPKREETVGVTVLQLLPPGVGAAPGLDDGTFLLVQRPDGGLLAGLWEFPSQLAAPAVAGRGEGECEGEGDDSGGGCAAAASPAGLQLQMAAFLSNLLGVRLLLPSGGGGGGGGPGGAPAAGCAGGAALGPQWEVLERRRLGSLVHIFSHIRQTMVVEKLVVRGELPLDTAGGSGGGGDDRPAMQWLSRSELEARGLSSGTAKVGAGGWTGAPPLLLLLLSLPLVPLLLPSALTPSPPSQRKVLKLLLKDAASQGRKGGSITKFFKPLAKPREAP